MTRITLSPKLPINLSALDFVGKTQKLKNAVSNCTENILNYIAPSPARDLALKDKFALSLGVKDFASIAKPTLVFLESPIVSPDEQTVTIRVLNIKTGEPEFLELKQPKACRQFALVSTHSKELPADKISKIAVGQDTDYRLLSGTEYLIRRVLTIIHASTVGVIVSIFSKSEPTQGVQKPITTTSLTTRTITFFKDHKTGIVTSGVALASLGIAAYFNPFALLQSSDVQSTIEGNSGIGKLLIAAIGGTALCAGGLYAFVKREEKKELAEFRSSCRNNSLSNDHLMLEIQGANNTYLGRALGLQAKKLAIYIVQRFFLQTGAVISDLIAQVFETNNPSLINLTLTCLIRLGTTVNLTNHQYLLTSLVQNGNISTLKALLALNDDAYRFSEYATKQLLDATIASGSNEVLKALIESPILTHTQHQLEDLIVQVGKMGSEDMVESLLTLVNPSFDQDASFRILNNVLGNEKVSVSVVEKLLKSPKIQLEHSDKYSAYSVLLTTYVFPLRQPQMVQVFLDAVPSKFNEYNSFNILVEACELKATDGNEDQKAVRYEIIQLLANSEKVSDLKYSHHSNAISYYSNEIHNKLNKDEVAKQILIKSGKIYKDKRY